ncbi:MAG: hypothetical protein ACOYMQ_11050 [Pseudanabaena sp.]
MRKVTSKKLTATLISSIGLISIFGVAIEATLRVNDNLAIAQTPSSNILKYQITVNSDRDGDIQPDLELTLREAIAIANGSLTLEQLSNAERSQVKTSNQKGSQIGFSLPSDRTTILLRKALPDISSSYLVIDGTTQSGYDSQSSFAQELAIPQPIVAIAPRQWGRNFSRFDDRC